MKDRYFYLYSLLFLLFWGTTVLYAQEKKQERFTIMGVGDSITEGSDSFESYLFPLWQKLLTGGYQFDFIGPRESKCRIGILNHCGFGGKNAEFLASKIDSIYRLYPADIVLLHAGHNHSVEEEPVPGMIAAYKSIISQIQAVNPYAHILVAQVIPSGKLPKYSYIPALNGKIVELVSGLHSSHISLVDQTGSFDWEKYTVQDKVHPNEKGAERMATVWFDALKTILPTPVMAFSPEIIRYKTLANGDSLTLHLLRPQQVNAGERRPAIVYFFGGGWKLGTPMQFYRECAYYASKGMVAVSVDYRIEYLHRSDPFDSFEDAKDAIRWLRKHAGSYGIDSAKIVAAGASAGGHLAAALGTIGSGEPDSAGYKPDLLILYYAVVDNVSRTFSHSRIKERYREISPMHHISEGVPPTIFMLGTKDRLVSVQTAEMFRDKLLRNGVDCELQLFEGAGHPIFLYRKELTDNFYEVRRKTDAFLSGYGYLPDK